MIKNFVHKKNINLLGSSSVVTMLMVFGPSFFLWCVFSPILPAYPVLAFELALPVAMAAIAPTFAGVSFLIFVALSLIVSISAIFLFTSPLELFLIREGAVGFSIMNSVLAYWQLVIVSIAMLLAVLVVRYLGKLVRIQLAIFIICFACFLDVIGASKVLPFSSFGQVNIFGSTIVGNLERLSGIKKNKPRKYQDEQDLSHQVLLWTENNPTRSVLFIVVESLGKTVESKKSNKIAIEISPPMTNLYKYEGGVLPFFGATTAGELRRLCQLRLNYYEILEKDVANCLPHKFDSLHYKTIGLHGFSSRVFSRGGWWESIGFNERIFLEDLPESNYQRCGSTIRGVCDDLMLKMAFEKVQSPRSFVYLLTLSTHLPLDESVVDEKIRYNCLLSTSTQNVCWIAGMHNKLLAQTLEHASKMKNMPLIVVVGDHPPPFLDTDERLSFSQVVVPFWIMYPQR